MRRCKWTSLAKWSNQGHNECDENYWSFILFILYKIPDTIFWRILFALIRSITCAWDRLEEGHSFSRMKIKKLGLLQFCNFLGVFDTIFLTNKKKLLITDIPINLIPKDLKNEEIEEWEQNTLLVISASDNTSLLSLSYKNFNMCDFKCVFSARPKSIPYGSIGQRGPGRRPYRRWPSIASKGGSRTLL